MVEFRSPVVNLHQSGAIMSFLFGKKSKEGKGQTPPIQRPQDVQTAPASGTSIPTANGLRPKERGAGIQSPTPGAGANISANSIENGNTTSPEHGQGQRGRQDSDLSVCHCSFINHRMGWPASMIRHRLFGASVDLMRMILILCSFSVAHGLFPTVILQVSTQQRFIPGLNDNSPLHLNNQIPSLGMVPRSMPLRLKKETYI